MNQTQEKLLQLRINEVLFYMWDPIGVSTLGPEPRDEYASYADHVWRMALDDKSKSEISAYLTEVSTGRMGLDARREADNKIAELILDWKDYYENPDRLG